jgi:hypothetical protein
MNKPRFAVLAGMVLAAAAARLIPHPPNFSPIAALALFGGAQFSDKRAAFLVPLAAMFLGDLVLGLHPLIPVVYGSFALITCLGLALRRRRTALRIAGGAGAGAMLFFVLTNLGVWTFGRMYPHTPAGLLECYLAAVPFFQNTLVSDLLYSAVLFGSLALAEKHFTGLREQPAAA